MLYQGAGIFVCRWAESVIKGTFSTLVGVEGLPRHEFLMLDFKSHTTFTRQRIHIPRNIIYEKLQFISAIHGSIHITACLLDHEFSSNKFRYTHSLRILLICHDVMIQKRDCFVRILVPPS